MIEPEELLQHLNNRNVGLFAGVPCSMLSPLIASIPDFIIATDEAEAMGIALGSSLAGQIGVVLTQNSGLGNMVDILTSFANPYKIPCLIIVSQRGHNQDACHHRQMGSITIPLLDLLGTLRSYIAWGLQESVGMVFKDMATRSKPAALIVDQYTFRKEYQESFLPRPLRRPGIIRRSKRCQPTLSYSQVINILSKVLDPNDLIISGAGLISRMLYTAWDRSATLYIQGAMGISASVGLGLSLSKPDRNIIILDGDGGTLMHLETLATVGENQPENYLHIVLDNECHASTGGQPTASGTIPLDFVALLAGYKRVARVYSKEDLFNELMASKNMKGPQFICVKIRPDVNRRVPRPSLSMPEITERFMGAIYE